MKISHSNKALILTGLIYLLVFGGIFLAVFLKDSNPPTQAEPVAVNLNMFQLEQPKPQKQVEPEPTPPTPLPEPEPEPTPEPEEIIEEIPEEVIEEPVEEVIEEIPEDIVEEIVEEVVEQEEISEEVTEEIDSPAEQQEAQPEPAIEPIQQPEFSAKQVASAEQAYLSELSSTLRKYALDTYPRMAQRRRQEGQVMLSFTIYPDGKISNLTIVQGSKNQMLDKAALSIFKEKLQMKFKAFPREIQKSEWTLSVPIEYKMR